MIETEIWGQYRNNPVRLFTIQNENGATLQVTNYGGRIKCLKIPDKTGDLVDVVLGFSRLQKYLKDEHYLGAIVGRYANRIESGSFTLRGTDYSLTCNESGHHLHGGRRGFDKRLWQAKSVEKPQGSGVIMSYLSKDGEEGYPGNLTIRASYILTNENKLEFNVKATTDRSTIVNITTHNYYNFSRENKSITDHKLSIEAEKFTPINDNGIPTGEIRDVRQTPFDFRKPIQIGKGIDEDSQQLRNGHGYDHNFVLRDKRHVTDKVASVYSPSTRISLEMKTNQPGLQFYSGNFLGEGSQGKEGSSFRPNCGFCLEPQNFPDSPNKPNFPSAIITPGEIYEHRTILDFTVS